MPWRCTRCNAGIRFDEITETGQAGEDDGAAAEGEEGEVGGPASEQGEATEKVCLSSETELTTGE